MSKVGVSAAAAAVIGGAMILFATGPAPAAALPNFTVATPADSNLVKKVDSHRRRERSRRYDRHRHGHRYRHRRPGFDYHYGGYYYANPWWIGPGIGFGVTVPVVPYMPTASRHVDWCLNNFRTYDVRSDTYMGFDGFRHRCNSPFR